MHNPFSSGNSLYLKRQWAAKDDFQALNWWIITWSLGKGFSVLAVTVVNESVLATSAKSSFLRRLLTAALVTRCAMKHSPNLSFYLLLRFKAVLSQGAYHSYVHMTKTKTKSKRLHTCSHIYDLQVCMRAYCCGHVYTAVLAQPMLLPFMLYTQTYNPGKPVPVNYDSSRLEWTKQSIISFRSW